MEHYSENLLRGKGLCRKLRVVLVREVERRFVLFSTDLSVDPTDILSLSLRRSRAEGAFGVAPYATLLNALSGRSMSCLIKWNLEKLPERRDFGETIRKQTQRITSKIRKIVESLKCDGASPHLRGSRCYKNFNPWIENVKRESDRDTFLFAIIQNHSRARAQKHSRRQ